MHFSPSELAAEKWPKLETDLEASRQGTDPNIMTLWPGAPQGKDPQAQASATFMVVLLRQGSVAVLPSLE